MAGLLVIDRTPGRTAAWAGGLVALLCLVGISSAEPLTAQSIKQRYDREVKPLLTRYCGDCHLDGASKGEVDLDTFTTLRSVQLGSVTWQKVTDNLHTRSMPPKKKPQPTDEERKQIQTWVSDALAFCDCTGPRDPGRVVIRRLNRNEYDNTVRDLLGLPADLNLAAADFPADDIGYGFDNIGDVLTTSPLLVEKYLAAAEKVLEHAIPTDAPVDPIVVRLGGNALQGAGRGMPRTLTTEGEAYRTVEFKQPGRYEIRVKASADSAGDEPAKMAIRVDDREISTIDVEAPRGAPRTYKAQLDLTPGGHRIAFAFVNDFWDEARSQGERDRNLVVHAVSVVGPIDGEPPPPTEAELKLLFARPGQDGLNEEQAATGVLERFATRAYRRPVSAGEVANVVALFKSARAGGEHYKKAIKLAMSGVLVSPSFLFRIEQERSDDPDKPYLVGDHELATRLSYFLWSSMPDDALTAAAASGKLRDPGALKSETARLLADQKSQQFVSNFVGQWLVMRNLEHHSVSRERYKDFNEKLRGDMLREVELFFANLIREDRSVLELLDSDYTFINERLAKLYGIDGVSGDDDFRRVSLKGTPRGGVLTMAGVLTVTAMPARTSPVKRGKFVLEQLLASPPPPPPPNTPSLSERRDDIKSGSVRQRFEAHRSDSSCVACHARMDPIGFALENFDAIGAWREKDFGFKIDASGSLPEGEVFDGPVELRKVLVARKDQFINALVEKMLTYALGRGLTIDDRCTVKEIAAAAAKDDYRFSSLVNAIVASDAFQKRRAKRPGE